MVHKDLVHAATSVLSWTKKQWQFYEREACESKDSFARIYLSFLSERKRHEFLMMTRLLAESKVIEGGVDPLADYTLSQEIRAGESSPSRKLLVEIMDYAKEQANKENEYYMLMSAKAADKSVAELFRLLGEASQQFMEDIAISCFRYLSQEFPRQNGQKAEVKALAGEPHNPARM